MQRIEKSGFQYPNLIVNSILFTFEDVLGLNGLNTALKFAGLSELVNNYPDSNLEFGADFADISSLFQSIEEIYGIRGSHALLTRAGRRILVSYRDKFAPLMTFYSLELKPLSHEERIKHGLDYIIKMLTQTGNQEVSSFDTKDAIIYQITNCSICFGRPKVDHAVCHMTAGIIQEALNWVSEGKEYQVLETACMAKGDPYCEFRISKESVISSKA
ncbi:MAG: hypothetical protein JW704_02310 [Anaerolineaceae bacterium]|nr:hypothetical protein [Anaerolineaceae bacterium]